MPDYIVQIVALELAAELEASRLSVCKVPSRNGYVRVAVTRNPEWYQWLCGTWKRPRRRYPKPRTIIRRPDTLRTLRRLANGEPTGPVYRVRIMEVVTREAVHRGYWSPAEACQVA